MAKPKRMSDIFASSAEKDNSPTTATTTPPYSSDGPTLPVLDREGAPKMDRAHTSTLDRSLDDTGRKKGKIQCQDSDKPATKEVQQPITTIHTILYKPWSLLPAKLLKSLDSNSRLRGTQNVVPVVFTKNHNVKAGINQLKTYLGSYKDKNNPIEMPEALKQADVIIAVSAQGEGTAKLVSILDMMKRFTTPSTVEKEGAGQVETWWLYISLSSVEVEQKSKGDANSTEIKEITEEMQEEEGFEPIETDKPSNEKKKEEPRIRRAPVLTAWITKKKIPMFKEEFGEQMFTVQTLPQDD